MFAVLHAGLAKKHRANPAAALRVEAVYGIAVLLSGLACLVLSSKEENIFGPVLQGPYTEDTETASSHPCPCSFPPSRVSPSPCPVAPENVFPVQYPG